MIKKKDKRIKKQRDGEEVGTNKRRYAILILISITVKKLINKRKKIKFKKWKKEIIKEKKEKGGERGGERGGEEKRNLSVVIIKRRRIDIWIDIDNEKERN